MANGIHIITVGAATQDVFLGGKALTAKRDVRKHDYVEQFPLGAKIGLDALHFDTGGGATNAAVTFARQGFKTSFMGKVAPDPAGAEILRVLKKESVGINLVARDTEFHTGYSTILLAPSGERTILTYRGASHNLNAKDFSIKTLAADWLYITSLAGNFDLLARLIKHAKEVGIKVALAPGSEEIAQASKLRKLIPHIEVLLANKEEMQAIFGGDDVREIMTHSFGTASYVVMTDGPKGTYASDSDKIYFAGLYQKVKVVDRLGAGDAFGSGFVSVIAQGGSIEDAITFGSANSTSVVQKVGAKAGILKTTRVKRMKVKSINL